MNFEIRHRYSLLRSFENEHSSIHGPSFVCTCSKTCESTFGKSSKFEADYEIDWMMIACPHLDCLSSHHCLMIQNEKKIPNEIIAFVVFSFFLLFLTYMRSVSFSAPWPDPTSPVLSKFDFAVPLPELFKWLDIRDTLLGDNYKDQDIRKALALARDCKHPDAEWLSSIFEGKDVSTKDEARQVFLSHENDARALCFAWHLSDSAWKDFTLLRRSSEMGNAFACSILCEKVRFENKEEAFRLARLAANQHERDGFYSLGRCFCDDIGCEKDLNLAKQNLLVAAELGDVYAADAYGDLLDESDPVCWLWRSRSVLHACSSFLDSFPNQVERFFSGSGNATVVFLIGRALKGNINDGMTEIFGVDCDCFDDDSLIDLANQAVSFYDAQIKFARLAVDTWTLVATRLHVIKDMRIYIGKMIWEGRFEATYDIDLDDDSLSSLRPSSSPDGKRSRK